MLNILGKTMVIAGLLLIVPLLVGVYYQENTYLEFLIPLGILCVIGIPLSCIKDKENGIHAKEGFVIVALAWLALSAVGALPFCINGVIPKYIDAVFETASGFSTTGASILSDETIEFMTANLKSLQFWRLFTHWIGGMGVLVFVLALLPKTNSGIMHVFRSESPGPSASKFVSKMSKTAKILYGIYIFMTLLEFILLLFSGIGVYESLLTAFSTAGTGGLCLHAGSIAYYNSAYIEMVVAVFMFLFGVSFNVYYLILVGQVKKIFRSEEFIVYISIVVFSTIAIAINLTSVSMSFIEGLRYGFFQVTSISSTTGFTTIDYDLTFPAFSKSILLILTMIGACGGSTGGGIKLSRILVLFRLGKSDVKKMINPRSVYTIKLEKEPIGQDVKSNVRAFIIIWFITVIVSVLLLSLDNFANGDIFTHLSSTLACIGNVGPGFNAIGPTCNYSGYSDFSKLWLSFVMLAGRLELFPMMILFSPRTWKRKE